MLFRDRLWVLAAVALGLCFFPCQTLAFTITAPAEKSVLTSGQEVTVTVDLGAEIGVRRVQYYWYRHGTEPVTAQQASASLVATASAAPPFGGVLTVPIEAVGSMRLLAVGEVARGRLASWDEFDEILVQVEPSAELTGIEFEVEKPWKLDTIGKILETPVVGQFADGVIRQIGGGTAGSMYQSSNDQVITVYPDGLLRVVGNGKATITVTNRGKQGPLEVAVKSDAEPNRLPTADAGSDLTVKAGTTVVLNGLRSMDPDGDPLQFEWAQIRGNKVPLLDPNTAKPTFVAPKVSTKRLLKFKLRVTDMKGPDTMKGGDSLPSFVNVWVEP
ncbi:MAG: PKD domain-containing protein [Nitrospiraceae bacterium]